MDMVSYTLVHVDFLSGEQLCGLAKATCHKGDTNEWYRPCVKEVHPYN